MTDAELEQVTTLCIRLGAPREQAARMAAQLVKRAEQQAAAQGITPAAALARLLQLVVQGHSGSLPPDFTPPPPRPPPGKEA